MRKVMDEPVALKAAYGLDMNTTCKRLFEFQTGKDQLEWEHTLSLDKDIIPQLRASNGQKLAVHIVGHASKLGDPKKNQQLSEARAERVHTYLKDRVNVLNWRNLIVHGRGEQAAPLGHDENDPRDRAVVVLVVDEKVKPTFQSPGPSLPVDWFVTDFSANSLQVVLGAGFTAVTGHITFEQPGRDKYIGPIGLFGPSVGLSYVPNLSKLPGFKQMFQKFPALSQFLFPDSAGLSSAFLDWLLKNPKNLFAQVVMRHPIVNQAIRILREFIGSTGAQSESWWSPAIGVVYSTGGRALSSADFSGRCVCFALNATATVAGWGTFILFFGMERNWIPNPLDLVDLSRLDHVSKGVAVIANFGINAQLPNIGASATVFIGEIV